MIKKHFFKTSNLYLLLTFFVFMLIVLFSFRPLGDDNEGLYAQIAMSMLKDTNFLIPKLNGLVYVEKPPLLYWLTATSFLIFGFNDFVARLPVLLSGFFLLVELYIVSRKFFSKTFSALIVLIIASQICFAVQSSMLMFDMPFTVFFSASMFGFYLGYANNSKYYRFFWFFLVLALLTKGPIAIALTCLITFPFIYVKKIRFRDLNVVFGTFMLALGSVWFIITSITIPSFFHYYFIDNHIMRFLGTMPVNDEIKGPIYFYVERLVVCTFPWSVLFFLGIYYSIKKKIYKNDFVLFMLLWFASIFVFFSISAGKANYYLLPTLYPFAFLCAYGSLKIPKWVYVVLLISGFLLVVGALAIKFNIFELRHNDRLVYKLPLVYLTSLIFLFYAVAFFKKRYAIYSIVFSDIVIFIGLFLYVILNQNYFTSKNAALWIKAKLKQPYTLVQYGPYWLTSTSVYYLNKNSLLLNDFRDGDLFYGMSLLKKPQDKFITFDFLKKLSKSSEVVIITTKANIIEKLNNYHIKPKIVKTFGDKIVVVL